MLVLGSLLEFRHGFYTKFESIYDFATKLLPNPPGLGYEELSNLLSRQTMPKDTGSTHVELSRLRRVATVSQDRDVGHGKT